MEAAKNSTDRLRAILVLVAVVATIVFNWLAAAGYINNVTPDGVSDRYPTALTPAGYAFSIWSLIYVGLIGFSLYQLHPANLRRFRGVRTYFILSCLLNCAWIYFWHHDQIAICFGVIFALFCTLVLILIKLPGCGTATDTWLMQAPLGLYCGWVASASAISLMILLAYMNTPGGSVLASVLILLAAGSAVLVRVALRNFFYSLAVAWAVTAIAVKQSGNTPIVVSAAIGVVVCLVTTGSFVTGLKDSTSE